MEKAATIKGSTKTQGQSSQVLLGNMLVPFEVYLQSLFKTSNSPSEKKANEGMENMGLGTIWRPWEAKNNMASDLRMEDEPASPVKTNPSPPKKLSCRRRLVF